MKQTLLIKNCRLYTAPDGNTVDMLIRNGTIASIERSIAPPSDAHLVIDAAKRIAAPGFIDVHIQGAGGADVLDGTEEALVTIARTLARLGTTSYLATTVVKPPEKNAHLKLAASLKNKFTGGAMLLGIHLEGPYINPVKKGGLDPKGIYPLAPGGLDEIYSACGDALSMMTIAPEMPGNLEAIRELRRHGTIASFAHSNATYEQTLQGFEAGINHVTHLFNAMPPLHHRSPGPIAAIVQHPTITAQLVSDGHHIHPVMIRLAHAMLGSNRCVCITDGMHGIGLPDGKYVYNGREYESKEGAARYLDGTLIGSTMSLGRIALKFKEFSGCSLADAIGTVTRVPAETLGIAHKKGILAQGKDADIVLFDPDFSIAMTLVEGEVVYRKAG